MSSCHCKTKKKFTPLVLPDLALASNCVEDGHIFDFASLGCVPDSSAAIHQSLLSQICCNDDGTASHVISHRDLHDFNKRTGNAAAPLGEGPPNVIYIPYLFQSTCNLADGTQYLVRYNGKDPDAPIVLTDLTKKFTIEVPFNIVPAIVTRADGINYYIVTIGIPALYDLCNKSYQCTQLQVTIVYQTPSPVFPLCPTVNSAVVINGSVQTGRTCSSGTCGSAHIANAVNSTNNNNLGKYGNKSGCGSRSNYLFGCKTNQFNQENEERKYSNEKPPAAVGGNQFTTFNNVQGGSHDVCLPFGIGGAQYNNTRNIARETEFVQGSAISTAPAGHGNLTSIPLQPNVQLYQEVKTVNPCLTAPCPNGYAWPPVTHWASMNSLEDQGKNPVITQKQIGPVPEGTIFSMYIGFNLVAGETSGCQATFSLTNLQFVGATGTDGNPYFFADAEVEDGIDCVGGDLLRLYSIPRVPLSGHPNKATYDPSDLGFVDTENIPLNIIPFQILGPTSISKIHTDGTESQPTQVVTRTNSTVPIGRQQGALGGQTVTTTLFVKEEAKPQVCC